MNKDEDIEIHSPNPVIKTVMQYLFGIVGGALGGFVIFIYFFNTARELMEKEFLFLLIAITLFCAFFGGWMVHLSKLHKNDVENVKE